MADLTTLEKARAYVFGDQPPGADADAILSQLVTSSSAWVESVVGPVLSATYTAEKYDGNGRTRLLLLKHPVTAVSALTVDGVAITARATVDGEGFLVDANGITLVGYTFTKGVQNVSVTYAAGYAAVPADLEQAVLEHVAFKYRRRSNLGVSSASAGGEAVSYADAGVLAGINDVLDRYRPVVIG